jgi:prepilin-type N-terminal cleavage/methylation domain-containing protein
MIVKQKKQAGFTLIELLMAFSLFSFVLLLMVGGFIYTMRIYQNGVATRNTQEAARLISETLTRQIRTASKVEIVGSGLCIVNNNAVTFEVTAADVITRRVAPDNNCSNMAGTAEPITSADVLVRRFEPVILTDTDSNPVSVELTLLVTSPTVDLLDVNSRCQPGVGSQFCSSTLYFNAISLRNLEPS